MKRILIYLSVILLSLSSVNAFAQGTDSGDKPDETGLYIKADISSLDFETMLGMLRVECFVTGEMKSGVAPVDVVLVLDVSGSMNDTKMNGLKSGCYTLLDQLMEIIEKGGDARVGIVTFNFSGSIKQEMTELDATSKEVMKTTISKITSSGDTDHSTGLNKAFTLLDTEASADRKKMVILFTDGKPAGTDVESDFTLAPKAIASAYKLKNISAEIFTIGLFEKDPSTEKITGSTGGASKFTVLEYLEHISSLYPKVAKLSGDASNFTWLDEKGQLNNFRDYSGTEYYIWAQTPEDLNGAFSNIGSTIVSKADVPLTAEAIVRDTRKPECDLPVGTVESDIQIFSAPCTGGDSDQGYTFGEPVRESNLIVSLSNKTLDVSGYDYGGYWVGWNSSTGQYQGRKLIAEIPFVINPAALLGKDVSQLETCTLGVFMDSTQSDPIKEVNGPVIEFVNVEISETGLLADESSVFVLEKKKAGESVYSRVATLVLTGSADSPGAKVSKSILYLEKNAEYRVARLGDWSWTYSNPADFEKTTQNNTIKFSFTNEKKSNLPSKNMERNKDNDFKGDGTLNLDVQVEDWNHTHKKRISF